MTILYPTPTAVEAPHHRPPLRPGRPCLRSPPTAPDHTAADENDGLRLTTPRREEEDRRIERQYQESTALDRLERGLCF